MQPARLMSLWTFKGTIAIMHVEAMCLQGTKVRPHQGQWIEVVHLLPSSHSATLIIGQQFSVVLHEYSDLICQLL